VNVRRYFQHRDQVVRVADGRTGVVKDVEGLTVNVVWDDDDTRDWQNIEDLDVRDG
jgi:hypothetical protein